MRNIAVYAGYLAGVFPILAYIPYIYAIFKKKSSPSRASWIIWSLVNLIILPSYFIIGDSERIWMPLAYAVGATIIMLLSFFHGEGGWTKFDKWCFAASLLSLGLWWVFNSPFLALLMNLTINTIGCLPTIKKVLKNPRSEARLPWILFFFGSLCNIISLVASGQYGLKNIIYPVTLFATVCVIGGLVLFWKPNPKAS